MVSPIGVPAPTRVKRSFSSRVSIGDLLPLDFRAFSRGVLAGYIALAGGAREPMLAEAARRLAASIEPGDDRAVHIGYLALAIDAQADARVVNDRRRPRGVERRRRDLIERLR